MEDETFWVKPFTPVAEETIHLPPSDQVGVRFIVPRVLCFKTDNEFSAQVFEAGLRSAVASTISEAPFLAGRVMLADEKKSTLKIEIPKDASVELRIRHIPKMVADDLDTLHWPPYALPFTQLCLAHRSMSPINFCFAVQANIISGGVVMVLHLNHSAVDGYTLSLVQTVLADHLSRFLNGEPIKSSGKIPTEALDRSQVIGTKPARPLTEWQDWRPAEENETPPTKSPLSLTVWYMSPEKVEQIRSSGQDPSTGSRLSTATCLSAFLWRAMTAARKLPSDATTINLTPIESRQRVDPKLPSAYCGNVLVYGRASATVSELPSMPLHEAGNRITRSIKWWNGEKIREYWGSIEECENLGAVKPNTNRDFGTDFEVSNIANMPFWNVDWGRGLHVRAFRWPGLAITDGWINVLPRLPTGGFELMMHLTTATLMNLLDDETFMDCLQYRGASDVNLDAKIRGEKLTS